MLSIIKNFTLFLGFCLTILLGLAVFGYFNFTSVLFLVLLSFFGFLMSLFYAFRNKKLKIERVDIYVLLIIIIFSLIISFFHHGLPDGRDDASYMSAAIMLTNTSSLSFDDPLTHAYSGFRNLEGNVFTSQFLPGYVVYLAIYFLFGGINFLLWANCLLLIVSLSLIYCLVKQLFNQKTALFSLALLGTFYTTFWFTKRLNSENLFMVFFWLGVLLFFEGLKNKKISNSILSLYSLFFCVFIRAEAIFYVLAALVLLLVIFLNKRLKLFYFGEKLKYGWKTFLSVFVFVFFGVIFGFYLQKYDGLAYFYKQFYDPWKLFSKVFIFLLLTLTLFLAFYYVLKKYNIKILKKTTSYLLKYGQKIIFGIIILSAFLYELVLFINEADLVWSFYQIQFNFKILGCYLILFYLVIILFGLYKQIFKKEELILFLLCSPTFLFLFRAQIAIDQPWFMRRFYPIFVPLIFILVSVTWHRFKELKSNLTGFVKKLIIILIIGNFLVSLTITFYRENYGMDKELKKFSQKFMSDDLVVMNPGWSWQKWAYPLHYLYNVNIVPRRELYSKKDFLIEVEKYKNELKNDDVIVKLKIFLDEKSFVTLQNLVKKYNNVYYVNFRDDMIVYPYRNNNLELISDFVFDFKTLSSDSLLIKYLKNDEIIDKKVANRIYNTPPVLTVENILELNIYKAKNKNDLFLSERKYDAKAIDEFRDYLEDSLETSF